LNFWRQGGILGQSNSDAAQKHRPKRPTCCGNLQPTMLNNLLFPADASTYRWLASAISRPLQKE